MPVIKLLLFTNHLATDDICGTQTPLMPIPTINPRYRYNCHRLLTIDVSKYPRPISKPQIVTTNRGPYLSVSSPTTIPSKPYISMDSEKAPDVMALVQLNSAINGFKKSPNDVYRPIDTSKIKKAAATTK
jgi:hypothetical protein